jgi:crossover junction endodeoxyribonuclease RuvC
MKILGIDPGYERVGVAIIETTPKDVLLHSECVRTSAKLPFPSRLGEIGEQIDAIIEVHKPDALAIETLLFNTNKTTAMKVSEARGVVVHAAVRAGVEVYEYTPLQIKNAITGYGHATKAQVDTMTRNLIAITKEKIIDDEMDAIATALTCSASYTQDSALR